ncbi:ABC transporter permease [Oribacterium sp. WCC10]|uniref:ABC transporter permease n=1 Tax=Oribacterium sp. WCC10 TaxID=1855343 RepID=UPI0008E062FD|nr:ABC transporter permease subunit [Oribacterium sp. WCC10]SFG43218.1 carbohydrate ABC transporter membrane protein 1, CUT1 family [Oribacterium sp. WCC10]
MNTKMERANIKRHRAFHKIWQDRILYVMLFPTIVYFCVFRVWPIINMRLAFYDFKARGSWTFVGLKYFRMIFKTSAFMDILRNTLIISFMKYVLLFPFFVIFAICLTELRWNNYRKYVQVISYLPHFLSWVVIAGIWISFLAPSDTGGLNQLLSYFNLGPVDLMTSKKAIRWILMICEGWRSLGWDSIIYFTTIIGIDASLYEAAMIDGASHKQLIRYVVLPALIPPMTTMFILNLGFFMSAGFDQVYNFTNPAVNSVIDILDTYINRVGIENAQYSISTAVSLIKGLVGVVLVYATHITSKKITGEGVW